MNAHSYFAFLKENILSWYNKRPLGLTKKIIFKHDNAPSHSAGYTCKALAKLGIKEGRLMVSPACSPVLNPIEKFWSMLQS